MKRNITLLMGALAVALVPALAQQPAAAPGAEAQAKVHGHVTNPTGAPQNGGTVECQQLTHAATGPGLKPPTASQGTFNVDANGAYTGQVPPGTYTRDLPLDWHWRRTSRPTKLKNVKVVAGAGYGGRRRHVAAGIHRQAP